MTTTSHSWRAARNNERWPSWRKPIVGTSPIVLPPARCGTSAARSSSLARTRRMPPDAGRLLLVLGEGFIGPCPSGHGRRRIIGVGEAVWEYFPRSGFGPEGDPVEGYEFARDDDRAVRCRGTGIRVGSIDRGVADRAAAGFAFHRHGDQPVAGGSVARRQLEQEGPGPPLRGSLEVHDSFAVL